jgi:hypothetical protein
MKRLFLTLVLCAAAHAQVGTFHAPVSVSLTSTSATTVTIQQPASGAKQVTFIAAVVNCPGQPYTIALTYNGTAATSTSATVYPMLTTSANTTNHALAWSASNVGSGTSLLALQSYISGPPAVIDLTKPGATMAGNGTGQNLSLTMTNTGSGTCSATIDIIWQER